MHTLTVDDDCDEMQTFFVICGPVLYIDDDDAVVHVEDNVGLIELCKEAYAATAWAPTSSTSSSADGGSTCPLRPSPTPGPASTRRSP